MVFRFPALAANLGWEFSQAQVRAAGLPAALGALASLKLPAGRGEPLGGWTREGSARRALTLTAIRSAGSQRRKHGGRVCNRESFYRGRAVLVREASGSRPHATSRFWLGGSELLCFVSFSTDGERLGGDRRLR